jgi:biotin carboxyl carrier protein
MHLTASTCRLLKPLALCGIALPFLMAAVSCTRTQTNGGTQSYGVVVVNAPAAGVVRRVLVSEGAQVNAETPIVEITVQEEVSVAAAPSPGESAESQAVRRVRASGAEIDAARAEVVRHEAEVLRLTPLVASGEAGQAQLDGERALYEQAQQRLQKAQEAEKQAQTGLLAARQPGAQTSAAGQPPAVREQTVLAKTSSAGTVSVISVRAGERVTSGQPLATLRADAP